MNYQILKTKYIMLLAFALCSLLSAAQTFTVRGTVKDVLGYPMQSVLVESAQEERDALTDQDGKFSLLVEKEKGVLTFSFLGFKSREIAYDAHADAPLVVVLEEEEYAADATLAIPFGSMNKKDVTSAISTVKGTVLERDKSATLESSLVGNLNGFMAFPSSYEPGSSIGSFYIRGLKTTAGNNAPLIIIDDVERNFSQLMADEIEEISVLKDAAALALYGSRGANGVILVTTKRGKANRRQVTVNAQAGIHQNIGQKDYLNAYDYARLYNQAWVLDGNTTPFYSDEAIEGYKKTVEGAADANPYRYPNNDYQKLFLNDYSIQQKYDVTMSGGNDFVRYYALAGYLSQGGVFKYTNENDDYSTNTHYQRFNFRTNVDININPVLSAFVDMAGRIELRHYPNRSANDIFTAITQTPANAYPIFNPDQSLGGTSTFQNNPYGLIAKSGYSDNVRRSFDATAGFKIDFGKWVEGLSFKAHAGFDFYNLKYRGLWQNFKVYQLRDDGETYDSYGTDEQGTFGGINTGSDYYSQYVAHAQFDYKRDFLKHHHLSAMAMFDLSSRTEPGNVPSYKNVAFGARVQYNYMQKYYLELVASTTANEAFRRGNRFGFFPAVSVGWTLSEEKFMKQLEAVDYLKLRASFGKTGLDRPYGTDASYRFLYLDNWSSELGGYGFGNPSTYYTGSGEVIAANPDIRWEDSYKTNVGIDLSLLNNKLYFTGDYYYERRTGIWVKREGWIPSTFGVSVPYENLGSAESSGVELTLGTTGGNRDFQYDVKGMVNYMTSRIIDLQEAPKTWDYQYSAGKNMSEIWALLSDGFYQDEEDIANHAVSTFGTVRPGDIKYVDVNDDGVIDSNDYVATGKTSLPKWTFSLSAELKYKDFDFSMLWQGMADRYVSEPVDYAIPFLNKNAMTDAYDAWTPENTDAKYPRLTTSNFENNRQYSDFWLKNGSYLRLRSIELGYSLPQQIVNQLGIAKLRFYINGYNLWTLTGLDYDPECTTAGINQYPASRIYTLGVNLTF